MNYSSVLAEDVTVFIYDFTLLQLIFFKNTRVVTSGDKILALWTLGRIKLQTS
jgi:hypothetical protein